MTEPMPAGASRRPVNLDRAVLPRGAVIVLPERCKGCRFCIDFCPKDVLAESEAINTKGYHYPVVAPGKESSCVHCEFCTLICPEMAIFTEDAAAQAAGRVPPNGVGAADGGGPRP